MNKNGNLLTYIAFAIVGILITYNTNFSNIGEVQASPPKPIDLPTLKFNPKDNLSLEIDLERGISNIKSDMPVTDVDVTVNHPTKIVEKVVEKPIIKKEVVYETKTEYLEKVALFTLPTPHFHVPNIELPKTVRR